MFHVEHNYYPSKPEQDICSTWNIFDLVLHKYEKGYNFWVK